MASRSSPSPRTGSGSRRTPGSSTSRCRRRTWPPSTPSTRPAAPARPAATSGGKALPGLRAGGGAKVAQDRQDAPVAGVSGVQAELAEDRVDVLAHGAVGDDEGRADLGVG